MKRHLLLASLLMGLSTAVLGQYYYIPANINPNGNPGGLNTNYEEPLGDGLAPGWVSIDPLNNSPAWSAVQNIPFTFLFNGQAVTQYKASNTGVLTFTTTASTVPGTSNDIIPNANIPDKSILVWGIAYTGGNCNDRIVVKTFGTAPNRQHWIQFNTYNIPGSQWCWLYYSIVLEESTNNIYIVDQRCNEKGFCQPTLTVGVQINSTAATMVAGSPNLQSVAGTSKTPVDNKYYSFIHGVPATRDVGVSWLQMGNFLIFNAAPFDVKGKVKNYTANMVNDYDINYSVNGGPPVTCNMSGAAYKIQGYGEEWFIHDSAWTPADTGVYHLKFWASNINGGSDENNSNDTMYKTIEVSHAFTPKLRLFEEFTSSTCEMCKDANTVLKSVLDRFPGEYALIKYPMNYPDAGDPYATPESETRRVYYGVDSLPDMFVNGTMVVDPLYIDTLQFNELWDKSFLYFTPTHSVVGNTISVTAPILPFQTFTQGTLVVRFAVVETVTHNNTGSNGETVFYNTFKKFIPDAVGVNLGQLQQQVHKVITRSYTFPSPNTIENWNNLAVIVFVQDEATKQVYQAAYSQKTSHVGDQPELAHILKLSPNPARSATTLEFLVDEPGDVFITLVSAGGQTISTFHFEQLPTGVYQREIELQGFSAGLYFIKLSTQSSSSVKKLLVH